MTKHGVVITVRSKSSRLPEKCHRLILPNISLLEYVIIRALKKFSSDSIVVATTDDPSDDFTVEIAKSLGVAHYRGSTTDKIDRWQQVSRQYSFDYLLCFDADDPFTDLDIGCECLKFIKATNASLTKAINLPCGSFTYVVDAQSLSMIANKYDTTNSEMMWVFFEQEPNCRISYYDCKLDQYRPDIENVRLTVDYQEDLDFSRILAAMLLHDELNGTTPEILDILRRHPHLERINQHRQLDFTSNQKSIISQM